MFKFVYICSELFKTIHMSEKLVIRIKEVIELTGFSRTTIYGYMKDGCEDPIPFWRKGSKILFDEQEIKDWIRNGR